MNTEPIPQLLTTNEIAELFRVNPRTVNKWSRAGLIKAVEMPGGKGYRFRRSDIEALVASEAAS